MARGNTHAAKTRFERLETRANETLLPGGQVQAHYRKCLQALDQIPPGELAQRQDFIDRATGDLGLYADRLQARESEAGAFSMDLFPRILRSAEWKQIERGVLQRVTAYGALIKDIHGPKTFLRTRRILPELIFEDPSFHPELQNLPMTANCPITVGAMDLLRTEDGRWHVLENRFSTPTGISYVIQIRRILAQALPELFRSLPVFPVASFATRLSEALADQAPKDAGRRPLVVLLSEGESGRHFFEESFLARHMGIPLTRPRDMVIRDGRVFLKTIEGLLQIHVIYRRLEPPDVDPVAFASAFESGIPGLIQCIRRGTVTVANALGCAVADNRALLRHADRIVGHYTGKAPLLPTVPTYHGYDLDQVEFMREHRDSLIFKTVCHPEILRRAHPEAGALFDREGPGALLEKDPRLVVAQALPEPGRLPVYQRDADKLEAIVMRVFCITGNRPYVLPGGLTRLYGRENERLESGRHYHALKDTWVLHEERASRKRMRRLEPELNPGEIPLPSSAAEAFYWMGRYLERGRGTARMMNTLEELRWGELTPGERELYLPLWRGLLKVTGEERVSPERLKENPKETIRRLLLDKGDPASATSCFNSVRWNAQSIRSFITPELWRAILSGAGRFAGEIPEDGQGPGLRNFIEEIVETGDRIYGTAERTLLKDAGWNFLNIGIQVERGITNITVMAEILPHVAKRQYQHLRDDTDLTALLRLLGSLDAYHRKYRSRAYLDRVAQLLWKSNSFPGSIRFIVQSVEESLGKMASEGSHSPENLAVLGKAASFIQWLDAVNLGGIFPARALELDKGLTEKNQEAANTIEQAQSCLKQMKTFLESLHEMLEDHYFSHHPAPGSSS